MNPFSAMLKKITSSSNFDQMIRFSSPLKECMGINHFWYYKITSSGDYSFLGSHASWSEFCFDKALVQNFPCLRHPRTLMTGINLMRTAADDEYKKVLETAWDKFRINFCLNLTYGIPDGIEAFGFATCFNDCHAEERLLNDLPLLRYFIKNFRIKFKKLFHLLDDNQVNLPAHFGPVFYEQPKTLAFIHDRDKCLRKFGFEGILTLTTREKDILKFLANGYPSSYVAKQLKLSQRTVENYIVTIKSKLFCDSKVELIQKAQDFMSTGYFLY